MKGLNSVELECCCRRYIPVLTQYCSNLTTIEVSDETISVSDIMLLCHTNPLLTTLSSEFHLSMTDTTLIELIHACPHLHTLCLSTNTAITETCILALSEQYSQLKITFT